MRAHCINRNIVECKGWRKSNDTATYYVLIETLWNVKLQEIQMYAGHQKVLIETLWNVKWTKWECGFDSAYRINRNIVECKVVFVGDGVPVSRSINRNIVECKGKKEADPIRLARGINRNIVECKGRMTRLRMW